MQVGEGLAPPVPDNRRADVRAVVICGRGKPRPYE